MLVSYMPLANWPVVRRAQRAVVPYRCQLRHAVSILVHSDHFLNRCAASAERALKRLASEGSKRGHIAGARERAQARRDEATVNEQRRNHGRRRQRPPRVSTHVAIATARAADGRGAARNTKEEARRERGHGPARRLLSVRVLAIITLRTGAYFDRGYSNYHAVAQFFSGVLEVDMLTNVLADRKNMLYEELLEYVQSQQMLVTCCIDAHFTAFQCLERGAVVHYDPAGGGQKLLTGDGAQSHVLWHLLKCGYGNSQHIQENPEDYYTSFHAPNVRRKIFKMYRDLNRRYGRSGAGVSKNRSG